MIRLATIDDRVRVITLLEHARASAGFDRADGGFSFPFDPAFAERLAGWQQKALREAKLASDWVTPNEALSLPFQTSVKDLPPSLDSYSPGAFAPGSRRVVPPLPITCERPRTPWAEPTRMWFAFGGSTTISLMPRPRNASCPGVAHELVELSTQASASFVQLSPPFVER